MKQSEKDSHKEKKFLNMPSFPGGKKALTDFVNGSLHYPAEALQKGIEGTVVVGYDVDHQGQLSNIHVLKGVGYGCDEEALRIVSLLRYNPTHNRGIRVKKSMKLRIDFHLKKRESAIRYQLVTKNPEPEKDLEKAVQPGKITYSYSIPLGRNQGE